MANDTTPELGKDLSGAGYTESDRKLRKELSFTQLLFLSLGGIIGSGWLFAVSSPYGLGIAGPAVILAWVIGGILVMIIALTYAEVAGMLPRTGAIVRYPSLTHGGYTGSIIGWAYLLSAVSVPAIEAIAVVTYASVYYPSLLGATVSTVLGTAVLLSGTGVLAAFLLLIAFFFLNFFGIKLLGRFNQGMTWWKLIIPVLTFIFLFSAFHASNFTVSFPGGGTSGFTPYGWAPVFESIALAGIIFSYLGFRQALDFGGEAKNPGRTIPLATILSVAIGIAVYTLLQISFIGAINWGAAGIPVGDWKDLALTSWAATPFYSALGSSGIAFLGAFASLLLVDAWISPAGTGWIYLGTSSRTFYGLSADGFFGRLFLRMNRWGIPWVALVASVVVGTLFLVPFPSWYLLVGFITLATTFTYIMGGVGLQAFRWHAPGLKRHFRLPAGEILAGMAFVAATLIVYWGTFSIVSVLTIMVFAGIIIYILVYAPTRLGVHEDVAYALGVVFIAILVSLAGFWYYSIIIPYNTGAATGPGLSSTFLTFLGGIGALALVSSLVLYLAAAKDKRREVASGVWVIVFMLVVLTISFYGAFGFDTLPYLSFPWDSVAMIIAAIIVYFFAIFSSYKTPELAAIESAHLAEVTPLSEGEGGASGGMPAATTRVGGSR
jgi:amino acid transporter